jgi:biotin synthase
MGESFFMGDFDAEMSEKSGLIFATGERRELLHSQGAALRREWFGNRIFIRGVVEVSNFCRENCNYCAMRRDNRSLDRYRISLDEALDAVLNHRPASITDINIQAGEDPIAVREIVLPLVREIRRQTELGVSVCLGTLSHDDYAGLREAGATYYIIKLETGNEAHYRRILAPGTFAERIQAIRHLAATGWNVSSGFIVDLPGQSTQDILDTLNLLEELPLAGCSVSPFIPGQQTPYESAPYGSLDKTLNCLAMMRIAAPHRIIPAVSAMTFQDGLGYRHAIEAGANLATINLTPENFRDNYRIYKKDRLIMTEQKVLEAIAQSGCRPSEERLSDRLPPLRPPAMAACTVEN